MTTWISTWGRKKRFVDPDLPAKTVPFAPIAKNMMPMPDGPIQVYEDLHSGIPLSHRIGLALDQACQGSGLKQWRWLKQMDIPARAFLGWKTGSIALSLKSLERLLPAIGWTLTITDPHGQVIVTSGPTPPDAS